MNKLDELWWKQWDTRHVYKCLTCGDEIEETIDTIHITCTCGDMNLMASGNMVRDLNNNNKWEKVK